VKIDGFTVEQRLNLNEDVWRTRLLQENLTCPPGTLTDLLQLRPKKFVFWLTATHIRCFGQVIAPKLTGFVENRG
jgi:hypothetical protein